MADDTIADRLRELHDHPLTETVRAKIVTRNLNFYYGDVHPWRYA